MESIYDVSKNRKAIGQKAFVVLVDPDDMGLKSMESLVELAEMNLIDYFLVGGSLMINDNFHRCIHFLKSHSQIPVLIFPGNNDQISDKADGILLLSLISGRNPELLIGKHVQAAPELKRSRLEIIPTGYMLIDGGALTSVAYMSNTLPIPADKPDIAACTAMAGEMLGMKYIYMDAGSGARNCITAETIKTVANAVNIPLWVGGGIHLPQQVFNAYEAGADIVVVGNAIENDPNRMNELAAVSKEFKWSKVKSH